jgi:hypothetical protein
VNVAKIAFGAEQVSFLVPVKFAAALLAKPRMTQPLTAKAVRAEIGTQLTGWQKGLFAALEGKGFKATENGPYSVPESASNWFTCWANTNADEKPKPRARADATNCNMQNWLFIAGDLYIGNVSISRTHFTNQSLNSFQFANFVSDKARFSIDRTNPKRSTAPACHEDIVRAGDLTGATGAGGATDKIHPPIRLVWCASAYREFEGLYNISFMAVTQDQNQQAIAMTVSMGGTDYENATRLAQRLIAELRVKP